MVSICLLYMRSMLVVDPTGSLQRTPLEQTDCQASLWHLSLGRVTPLHLPVKTFIKVMQKSLTVTGFENWGPFSKVATLNIRLISFECNS